MKQYTHDDFDLFDEDDELELALRASLATTSTPRPGASRHERQQLVRPDVMTPRPRIDYGRALVRTMLSMNHTLQAIAERLDDDPYRHPTRDDDCAPRRPTRDERCDPCRPRQRPQPQAVECAPRQATACDGEAVFLGIDSRLVGSSEPIKPNETKTFVVSTTGPLQITDFYVGDREAPDFVVSDIKIGRHSRLESGRLPASMFSSEASQRVPMQAYLPASGEVRIEVTNISAEPRHFSAGFTGYEV